MYLSKPQLTITLMKNLDESDEMQISVSNSLRSEESTNIQIITITQKHMDKGSLTFKDLNESSIQNLE